MHNTPTDISSRGAYSTLTISVNWVIVQIQQNMTSWWCSKIGRISRIFRFSSVVAPYDDHHVCMEHLWWFPALTEYTYVSVYGVRPRHLYFHHFLTEFSTHICETLIIIFSADGNNACDKIQPTNKSPRRDVNHFKCHTCDTARLVRSNDASNTPQLPLPRFIEQFEYNMPAHA